MGSSRRWWLNQDTHSSVANSTDLLGRAAIGVTNQAAVALGLTVVQRLLQSIEDEDGRKMLTQNTQVARGVDGGVIQWGPADRARLHRFCM